MGSSSSCYKLEPVLMLPTLLPIVLLLLPTRHCNPALSRWSSPAAQSFLFLQHRLGPGDTYFRPLGTLHPLWAVPPQTGSRQPVSVQEKSLKDQHREEISAHPPAVIKTGLGPKRGSRGKDWPNHEAGPGSIP